MMFSGFRSRWMIPTWWAAAIHRRRAAFPDALEQSIAGDGPARESFRRHWRGKLTSTLEVEQVEGNVGDDVPKTGGVGVPGGRAPDDCLRVVAARGKHPL